MMPNPFFKEKYVQLHSILRRKGKLVSDKRIRINNMIRRQEAVLKKDYEFDKK